jgi:hypothetical protein
MRRANAKKRLHVNQRVSGALGEYINGPNKHCCQNRIVGHIIVPLVSESTSSLRSREGKGMPLCSAES